MGMRHGFALHKPRLPSSALALAPTLALLALSGCPMAPSGYAKAQQVAQDMNLDTRFGRTEFAMHHVASAERDDFAAHHRAWGNAIRVADLELGAMKPHGEHDLDILVHVTWYRADQQELRNTTLKQRWHPKTDDWELVGVERIEGDIGLIGEAVFFQAPAGATAPSHFPTIHLKGVISQP